MVAEELHKKGQPRKQEISTFRAKRKAIYEASKVENEEKKASSPQTRMILTSKERRMGRRLPLILDRRNSRNTRSKGGASNAEVKSI